MKDSMSPVFTLIGLLILITLASFDLELFIGILGFSVIVTCIVVYSIKKTNRIMKQDK